MTKKEIKELLDKALDEQTKTIVTAVNFSLQKTNKRIDKTENKVNEIYKKLDKFLLMHAKQEQENKIILIELKTIKNVLKQKLGVDIDKLVFA